MKVENHILDLLELYEYAMAIGKSLDYKENCDRFLKLILKRKNLNAAWILELNDNTLETSYSIPKGRSIQKKYTAGLQILLQETRTFRYIDQDDLRLTSLAPIDITKGFIAIFNLKTIGYLFLFSKENNLSEKKLVQLKPVINKFSTSLKACKVFKAQQQLLNNLETRNQELNDYAHMVSHDLKSPLRSIDSLSLWLKEDYKDKIDNAGQQQLQSIRENVEKMDDLIEGILKYSTIGKFKDEAYLVDLNKLLKDVVRIINVPKHITISIHPLPGILGDKYRLQQLFQNLIDNALRYNDKPKGIIEVGYTEQVEFWQFYIKDNGIGIEKKYFNRIFKTFEKLSNTLESTGIGLSIVKKIVDMYGGKIWLKSTLNKGTTFFFTLKK